MKFKPDRDNTPFYYKGYECWIRRAELVEGIEIRLVYRDAIHQMMIIRFIITNRKRLFSTLSKAIKALNVAEKRLKCIATN